MLRRARLYLLMAAGIALALSAGGCNWFDNPVSSEAGGGFDVRATVLSHIDGTPIYHADVECVETGSHSITNEAGQSLWLLAPNNTNQCHIHAWYGQITTTVAIGLSRNPTDNQPVLYLASKAPVIVPQWAKDGMARLLSENKISRNAIFVPDQNDPQGGMIVEIRNDLGN